MSERTENLGMKAIKEREARVLAMKANGLRGQIHRAVNPFKPLAALDADAVVVAAMDLQSTLQAFTKAQKELQALCAELGEPVPTFE